jgi:inorganic pyrophosphatase
VADLTALPNRLDRKKGTCRVIIETPRGFRKARVIGIIHATQTEKGDTETNDRLLGVAIHYYEHEDLKSISGLSKTLFSQFEEFFISYNKQRGKKFKITGTGGPGKAVKYIEAGIRQYKSRRKKA